MSIQVLPEMPTTGQALGQAFTGGLAETLPKYAEKGALSAGLQSLAKKAGTLTPLEMVAHAQRLPGMTDTKLAAIMPFLQSTRAESAAMRESGKMMEEPSAVSGDEIPAESDTSPIPIKSKTTMDDEPTVYRGVDYLGLKRPPEFIRAKAVEMRRKTGRTFDEEVRIQQEKYDTKAEQEKQFISSKEQLTPLVMDKLKRITQAYGFEDIPGNMQERKLSSGYEQLKKNPGDPLKVAEDIGKEIDNFMKIRTKLKTGAQRGKAFFNPNAVKASLETAKNLYAKEGEEELFRDDLVNFKDISKPYATLFAFENSSNVKQALNSNASGETLYSRIEDSLSKKDNLLSIATAIERMRKPNTSAHGFLRFVGESNRKNELRLTPFQTRELVEPPRSFEPNLTDILYFTMLGRKI